MYNDEMKWSSILSKSCNVDTAILTNYVWLYFIIICMKELIVSTLYYYTKTLKHTLMFRKFEIPI